VPADDGWPKKELMERVSARGASARRSGDHPQEVARYLPRENERKADDYEKELQARKVPSCVNHAAQKPSSGSQSVATAPTGVDPK
ncbi:MAG TPA: hypothetical protein VF783_16260, partial [Terriglobales bacterium]